MKLTKNQLSFLAESSSDGKTRPVLQYIFYIPEHKELVSTDTFRLHTLSIDLGDEPLCFDKKGNEVSMDGKKFPSYKSFYPGSERYDALIDIDIIKTMDSIMKHYQYSSIINYSTGIIKDKSIYVSEYKNLIAFDLQYSFIKPNGKKYPEHDIGINVNYLYNTLRYFDKTSRNGLSRVSFESKNPLLPQVFYGTIDGVKCSSLIMPLKI